MTNKVALRHALGVFPSLDLGMNLSNDLSDGRLPPMSDADGLSIIIIDDTSPQKETPVSSKLEFDENSMQNAKSPISGASSYMRIQNAAMSLSDTAPTFPEIINTEMAYNKEVVILTFLRLQYANIAGIPDTEGASWR